MIDSALVFDSVRRGYNDLNESTKDEILEYFDDINPDSMIGHVNNIKGILFEQVYVDQLAEQGIYAEVFEATNTPIVDISVFDSTGVSVDLQLKATDSVAYINDTLEMYPDVSIVATSEVANMFNSEMVIDSGFENAVLESAVIESLSDEIVNPFSPISGLGWLLGLPF